MSELTRYVSFATIDVDGNIQAVMPHLRRYMGNPTTTNAFWQRLKQRLEQAEAGSKPQADVLLLLHSHVYYMAELFEDHEDKAALAALLKLEEECF